MKFHKDRNKPLKQKSPFTHVPLYNNKYATSIFQRFNMLLVPVRCVGGLPPSLKVICISKRTRTFLTPMRKNKYTVIYHAQNQAIF